MFVHFRGKMSLLYCSLSLPPYKISIQIKCLYAVKMKMKKWCKWKKFHKNHKYSQYPTWTFHSELLLLRSSPCPLICSGILGALGIWEEFASRYTFTPFQTTPWWIFYSRIQVCFNIFFNISISLLIWGTVEKSFKITENAPEPHVWKHKLQTNWIKKSEKFKRNPQQRYSHPTVGDDKKFHTSRSHSNNNSLLPMASKVYNRY